MGKISLKAENRKEGSLWFCALLQALYSSEALQLGGLISTQLSPLLWGPSLILAFTDGVDILPAIVAGH